MSTPLLQFSESFPVMGNTATIHASSLDAIRYGQSRLEVLEALWSRFVPSSEISRLNAAEGTPVRVSRETASLLSYMREGHRATGGLYDPTVLPALCALGYAQSLMSSRSTTLPLSAKPLGDLTALVLEEQDGEWYATLPLGTVVDPGGIGKGLAADIVAEEITRLFPSSTGAAVSVGGDVRVIGTARTIDVEHPTTRTTLSSVSCRNGAAATSSITGKLLHGPSAINGHVLDPRTLANPTHDIVQVTVTATTCVWAEVFASACLVAGSLYLASARGLGALAVHRDDEVSVNESWSAPTC